MPNRKRNWGSEVIPKEKWIDPAKEYTCNGHRVIGLRINMYGEDSTSLREVTFPTKGTIIMKGRAKLDFNLWTLDGKHNITCDSIYDLVEVKKEKT